MTALTGTVHRLVLDDVVATYITDGVMRIRPDAFFPSIPPEQLDLLDGYVIMATGGLLVERAGRKLLIDTGFGPFDGDTPMGPVHCGGFLDALATAGVGPDEIDVVALTDLHVDHVGWLFRDTAHGRVPTFPRARYVVAADEWLPYTRGFAGTGAADPEKVVAPLAHLVRTFGDAATVFPGVTTLVTAGHSAGHTSYVITTSAGRRLIAFGDAFHLPAQLTHPGWPSAPDALPRRVPAARDRLLTELARPDTVGFGMHFGDEPFGRVVRDADGLAHWQPVGPG